MLIFINTRIARTDIANIFFLFWWNYKKNPQGWACRNHFHQVVNWAPGGFGSYVCCLDPKSKNIKVLDLNISALSGMVSKCVSAIRLEMGCPPLPSPTRF